MPGSTAVVFSKIHYKTRHPCKTASLSDHFKMRRAILCRLQWLPIIPPTKVSYHFSSPKTPLMQARGRASVAQRGNVGTLGGVTFFSTSIANTPMPLAPFWRASIQLTRHLSTRFLHSLCQVSHEKCTHGWNWLLWVYSPSHLLPIQ